MSPSASAATNLSEAVDKCKPSPLDAQTLGAFWVETQDARDALVGFRENLRELLDQLGTPGILVYGHRGCGKSTEINKLVSELPDHWLVVQMKSGDYLPTSGNQAADVLLAACTRLIEVVNERELGLNEKSMDPVLNYFNETTKTEEKSRESSFSGEAGVATPEGLLGKLLVLKFSLGGALKFGARSEESTVGRVRKRKGELSAAVTALTQAAELAWQKKANNNLGRLLLVIEDLDKLGLDDARRIFVEDGRLLANVGVTAIYTIPIFAFHSPDAGAIRTYFAHEMRLPMIKVVNPDGSPAEAGRDIIRQIVRCRVTSSVLPDDALDVIVERTGGVIRDVFQAIQVACTFRPVKQSGIINRENAEEALRRMQTEIGLQIGYPIRDDGTRPPPRPLQERLVKIGKEQAQKHRVLAEPDSDLQLLLMSGALLEYNGDGWLGVHPLARAYLKDLDYDIGD